MARCSLPGSPVLRSWPLGSGTPVRNTAAATAGPNAYGSGASPVGSHRNAHLPGVPHEPRGHKRHFKGSFGLGPLSEGSLNRSRTRIHLPWGITDPALHAALHCRRTADGPHHATRCRKYIRTRSNVWHHHRRGRAPSPAPNGLSWTP